MEEPGTTRGREELANIHAELGSRVYAHGILGLTLQHITFIDARRVNDATLVYRAPLDSADSIPRFIELLGFECRAKSCPALC